VRPCRRKKKKEKESAQVEKKKKGGARLEEKGGGEAVFRVAVGGEKEERNGELFNWEGRRRMKRPITPKEKGTLKQKEINA